MLQRSGHYVEKSEMDNCKYLSKDCTLFVKWILTVTEKIQFIFHFRSHI